MVQTLIQPNLQNNKIIKIVLPILGIYVAISSFTNPYKPHVTQNISPQIAQIKTNNLPVVIYSNSGSIAHGYYFLASQISNLDFQVIPQCPQQSDLKTSSNSNNTIVVAESCPQLELSEAIKDRVIYTSINGLDNEGNEK